MALFARRHKERGLRLFFCTDLHGSDQCFRKCLNAASFYKVDHLILGGDMTGKLLIPIVKDRNGTYSSHYADHRYEDLDAAGVDELKAQIRRFGHYPVVGTPETLSELEDEHAREQLFRKIAYDSIVDWVALAEERLRGTGIRCYVAPGNDDVLEIDERSARLRCDRSRGGQVSCVRGRTRDGHDGLLQPHSVAHRARAH